MRSAYLDIGTCLVGDFHDKLGYFVVVRSVHQEVEDVEVDVGAQVVAVRDEHELFAFVDEHLQESRVVERLIEISMARWVPRFQIRVVGRVAGNRKQVVTIDTWISTVSYQLFSFVWEKNKNKTQNTQNLPRLVEGVDLDLDVTVFVDDLVGLLVGVERVHKD